MARSTRAPRRITETLTLVGQRRRIGAGERIGVGERLKPETVD